MACEELRQGLDLSCTPVVKNYYQQIVLLNRKDVANKQILTPQTNIDDSYNCRYSIIFNLFSGKSGFMFKVGENASIIFGAFDKTVSNNIPQYNHYVNIAVLGVSEETRCILNQIDYADYFAAAQLYDGTIEIYGFEFGLTSANYTYDTQNNDGGALIKLNSNQDALEDEMPFIYIGDKSDFDNLFQDVEFVPHGDFNNDFKNDFNNF